MSSLNPEPTTKPPSTSSLTTALHPRTHPLPPHHILDPTPEAISRIITIISAAFTHTPLMITFMSELHDWKPSTPHTVITPQVTYAYYTDGITRIGTSGGILAESGTFSAVAIWEPPTYRALDFTSGRKKWGPASREWTGKVKAARITYLGVPGRNPPVEDVNETTETVLRPFWHLGFLARDSTQPKVPGAVSGVVLPFLERAREECVPAWLEATTLEGVSMYAAFGFRLVETIVVGKGVYGVDGWACEGGEGVRGYCMIYDQHLV